MPSTAPSPTPERLLHRLDWEVVRRLDGLLQGDYRGLFYGAGVDFADLRDYQPSDDVRHIDWNVTARMNTPYVRQYIEDREVTAWLLLDRTPSMGFGSPDRPKDQVMVELVTTLGRLLTRKGNRVGAILWNNAVERVIEPMNGRDQVLRIAKAMLEPTESTGRPTDLEGLVRAGSGMTHRRSIVFLISDFISEPGWERPLSLLAERHELVPIRLFDPTEAELPDAGVLVLEDAETGEQLYVDTGDTGFRQRYAEAAAVQQEQLQAAVLRAGVHLFDVSTTDDLVTSLVRMTELRKKLRR